MKKTEWSWNVVKPEKVNFNNRNFTKIFNFFVLNCPIEKVSVRTKTFKQLNINVRSLYNKIKKCLNLTDETWNTRSNKEIENFLREKKVWDSIEQQNEFIFHTNYIKNETTPSKPINSKTKGLFYTIRCAFAHGDFSIHSYNGKNFYQLQNTDGKIIKGRIILSEEHLLKIIDIVLNWNNYKEK